MLAEREALRCQEMDRPVKAGTGINQAQVDFSQEEKEFSVILPAAPQSGLACL